MNFYLLCRAFSYWRGRGQVGDSQQVDVWPENKGSRELPPPPSIFYFDPEAMGAAAETWSYNAARVASKHKLCGNSIGNSSHL